jgi:ERCC4-type nuclease
MSEITLIQIDSREPVSIQQMKFGGVPVARNVYMETGDLIADTDDGHRIIVERKTPDDFLNTLGSKDPNHQLFVQLARMVKPRYEQQTIGQPLTYWPYLVITEPFRTTPTGKVITARGETGWDWRDVNGALLKVQEMGVFVAFADSDADYEGCILRIGRRNRSQMMTMLPARVANVLGSKAIFIQSLARGIGMDMTVRVLDYYEDDIKQALLSICDLDTESPVGYKTRERIREMFGLADGETFEIKKGELVHAKET